MNLAEIISRNAVCVISLILLLILCLSNNSFERKRTNVFVIVITTAVLFILFDAVDIYFSYSSWENAYIIRNISCFIVFSLCPVIPCCLITITENKFNLNFKPLLVIVNFILCIINLSNGFMFTVSPENIYMRKPLYILPVLVSLYYLIGIVVSYLRSFKTIQKSEVVFIVCGSSMAMIALVLQIAYNIHFLLVSYITIALIFYYLFLNIQILRTDALTITLNRNMFEKDLLAYHHGERGVILVFDLNNLKNVNDEFGHTKGDKYIVYTANLIKRCFEQCGIVYRIGGDEFAVICKNMQTDDIVPLLSEFKSTLALTDYSVAVGYAEYNNTIKKHVAFKDADDAMYANKFFLKSHCKR